MALTLALAWGLIASGTALAQVPRDITSEPTATPEEMLDQALLQIEAGQLPEAADLVQRAKMINPTLDMILLAEALLDIESGRSLEAIQTLAMYNKTDEGEDDYRGHAAVGAIYKRSLKFRLADPALRKARDLAMRVQDNRSLLAELSLDLAEVNLRLMRFTKAAEAAREAERLAPDNPRVQRGLARIAVNSGDLETAAKAVERAIVLFKAEIRQDPFKEQTYLDLRTAYQLAVHLHEQQNTLRPEDGLPYFNLAVVLAEDAELNRRLGLLGARQYALEALARDPENNECRVFTARLEALLGATEEAWNRIDEVLRNDPNNSSAHLLRESLQSASRLPRAN